MAYTKILKIEKGSAAEEGGIQPGDKLLKINGKKIKDVFDYRFYAADEFVSLEMETPDGEVYVVDIEKDEYEDLGIEFENSIMDCDRSCANNCIFCFIDQMPPGMRDTLYFKDDDIRLSFLTGNYVTLTNTGYRELERIVKYHLSPINVSVHVTDPKRRCMMLNNKNAGDILKKIKVLVDGGITVNAQIVLCPGINDGGYLKRTVEDLIELSYGIASVSVVPVGMTKYRDGLYDLRVFTPEECAEVVEYISSVQEKCREEIGTGFIYLADEFYIKSDIEIPPCETYEDFPQIENGVGMASLLIDEVHTYIKKNEKKLKSKITDEIKKRKVIIATGVAAFGILTELASYVSGKFDLECVNVVKIINDFFGENVTVAGLITGGDLINQLSDYDTPDVVLITENMLRNGETVFLDDITVSDAEEKLNTKVVPCSDSGADFVNKLLGVD
ncbi:MAG: DUF512 domain-containing protein [Ruminococcaceae bacterium]|nr:DUF512 domain-containing protein [Oscillospiraceae bacterium]